MQLSQKEGAMGFFDGREVYGSELKKDKGEKLFIGEKDSAVLSVYDKVCSANEGSFNTEDTAKNIKKVFNQVSPKSSIGRRRDSRFQLINLRIALNKLSLFGLKSKIPHKASLVNLSANGIQVLTEERLKPGDKYSMNIFVPSLTSSMDIKAKVIWRKIFKKDVANSYYRVGFEFMKMDEEAENNLKKLDSTS